MSIGERFIVQKSLGKGGIGESFLVADRQKDGQIFALKQVPKKAFAKKIESLRHEFATLSRLAHPNIARVLEFGETPEFYFFIEEYVGGGDVFQALHGTDYNRVLSAFVQILRALHFLHREKILHGDLKPENILVVKDASLLREDTVKLIDFGLAQDLAGPRRRAGGSLHFLAPEILLEKPYDHRADLYALGVCLYRMTTGRYPFENGQDRTDLLVRDQIHKMPVAPGRFRTDLPKGLNDLAMRLLEKNPEDRPASAEEVLEALNRIEGEGFSILLRRERFGDDSAELRRRREEIRRLCAWADVPLSRETLISLMDLPADRLDACLEALEEEGALHRVLRDGSYHFEAASQAEDRKTAGAPVASLLQLAESSYRSGRLREARHVIETLAPIFEAAKVTASRADQAHYFIVASLVFLESGDLEKARGLCERFLKFPKLTHEEQGKIYGRLGWIAYRKGRYQEALKHFEESSLHWEKSGNIEGCVAVSNFQGMTYQALKEWDTSLGFYQKALDRLTEGAPMFPIVMMNRAIAAQEAGRYETAVADYEKARRAAEASRNVQLQARLLNNLANLYLYLGRLDQASGLAHRSLKLAVENGIASLEGNNYLLISVIADKEGRIDQCRESIEKSAAVFENRGTVAERATAALHRAYYFFTAGDEERVRKEIAGLRASYPEETNVMRSTDLLEGKIFARAEPPDIGGGFQRLQEAIRHFESQDDLSNLWDGLFTMGRLVRVERPEEAKRYFERSHEVLEKLTAKIPEAYRNGFFRDRKRERTMAELSAVENYLKNNSMKGEKHMATKEGYPEIARINRLLASENNLTYLLETILEESLELLQAERGFILLLEDGQFKIRVARNMDRTSLESEEDAPGRYSTTIARQAAAGSRSILVRDAQTDDRFSMANSVVELNIRAALAVPLKVGPEVVGVVYVDNRFSQGVFDEQHQKMLESFTDQAAMATRNSRQVEEIRVRQRELEASKRQIEELNGLLKERLDVTEKELDVIQEKYQIQQDQLHLRYSYDQIVGKSPRLRDVLKVLDRVTDSDVTVLIQGESGTGKELIARALHYNGPRKGSPFVAENCAAFSEELLESELFGHKKGSFTGATSDKQGLFEVAEGGTVFLDEIGELSPTLQSKLLRVLQERQIRPLGSNDYRKINVRVIAATNRDLKAMVKEGKFREDLYYRINVVKVVAPPLRDRKEDIPLLADYFLKQQGKEGAGVKVHPKAMTHLLRYDWPGNIRELANEIQKCCAMGAKMITPDLLSDKIREEYAMAARPASLGQQVSSVEKNVILETLKKHRYSRIKTAQALGVSRITLYKKMKSYGILARKPDYKSISAS